MPGRRPGFTLGRFILSVPLVIHSISIPTLTNSHLFSFLSPWLSFASLYISFETHSFSSTFIQSIWMSSIFPVYPFFLSLTYTFFTLFYSDIHIFLSYPLFLPFFFTSDIFLSKLTHGRTHPLPHSNFNEEKMLQLFCLNILWTCSVYAQSNGCKCHKLILLIKITILAIHKFFTVTKTFFWDESYSIKKNVFLVPKIFKSRRCASSWFEKL